MKWFREPVEAAFALPATATALLVLGAATAGAHGGIDANAVLTVAFVVTAVTAATAHPTTVPPAVVIAWLTVVGFSRPPYAKLQTTAHRGLTVAIVLVVAATTGLVFAAVIRRLATRTTQPRRFTLKDMTSKVPGGQGAHGSVRDLAVAVGGRRQAAGLLLAATGLPLVTALLSQFRGQLNLDDDLLLYLVSVVAITLVGGFWPAVLAAVASCLLLNWFFTPPLHQWTIDSPQNLLALLLFTTAAICVSSIVHLAARQAYLARRSHAESATLLELARTVLAGHDSAGDVVRHLATRESVGAELQERVAGRWIRLAATDIDDDSEYRISLIRADLRLRLFGDLRDVPSESTLEGYGAQAAAALDRDRLRIQAAQAEALAAGNRMRTALLTAVSHDLRTPLASVKASVSSLRQDDIEWSPQDRAALLETIEDNADRLDSLIGNLLDMSRIHTRSLQPLLRATSIEEVAPLAVRGLDAGRLDLDIPETLPLVATDPGLLERALANLVANALRFSPPDRPPALVARVADDTVALDVVDHGPGVVPEMRETIFEPFQQLGDQRANDGVGLGLAVARGFVEAMGGRIVAHETPGGGLTMRIELLLAAQPAQHDRHSMTPDLP